MPLGLLGGLDLFRELGERVTNSSPWGWFFSCPCSALGYPRRHWFTRTRWLARPEGKDLPKVGWQHSRFLIKLLFAYGSSLCKEVKPGVSRFSSFSFYVHSIYLDLISLSWHLLRPLLWNLEIFIKSQSSNTSFWMFSRHNPKRNLDSYESKFKYYDNLQSSPSNVCRLFF